MSATGDTPGLTTTSSPTAIPSTPCTDGVDHAGDVAPGHVRQRWLGHAAGDPEVHVVQRAGDDLDAHVVRPEVGELDRSPAVGARRFVKDPCAHSTSSGSDVHDGGVGIDRHGRRGDRSPCGSRRSIAVAAGRTSTSTPSRAEADRRVGHVRSRSAGAARADSGLAASSPIDLDEVEPVRRWDGRRDIPTAEAIDVERPDEHVRARTAVRATTWATPKTSRPSVSTQSTSDREPLPPVPRDGSAERGVDVPSDSRTAVASVPARRVASAASEPTTTDVVRRRDDSTPAESRFEIAISRRGPRRHRRPRRGTPAVHLAQPGASAAYGATSAIWRARSISCFIVRTKSPPVSSSSADDVSEAPRRRPSRGSGDERRIRRTMFGELVERSSVGEARRVVRSVATACGLRPTGTRAPEGRPGCGARTRTRTRRCEGCRVEPVEEPAWRHSATSRSHSWKIRDEHRPRGERPRPPAPSWTYRRTRQHLQHTVEFAGQRLAAPFHPPLSSTMLPLVRSTWPAAAFAGAGRGRLR